MTAVGLVTQEDRRWYYLALRHLRMATRLLRGGFADGAVFHAYHAYECLLSSFIAASGHPVPPEGWHSLKAPNGKVVKVYGPPNQPIFEGNAHKARIVFFDQLSSSTKPYHGTHSVLKRFIPYQARQRSLYYDAASNQLPHQYYHELFAAGLIPYVIQFARELRPEIL